MVGFLIWDFDGTLGYREGPWSSALLAVLEAGGRHPGFDARRLRAELRTGFPWHTPETSHVELASPELWWEALSPVFVRAFEAGGLDPTTSRTLAGHVREVYADPNHWRLFDDTLPALRLLSSRGWTHIVLSNHVPELARIVSALGLDDRVKQVFNSAESGYEKPHPRAFQALLEALSSGKSLDGRRQPGGGRPGRGGRRHPRHTRSRKPGRCKASLPGPARGRGGRWRVLTPGDVDAVIFDLGDTLWHWPDKNPTRDGAWFWGQSYDHCTGLLPVSSGISRIGRKAFAAAMVAAEEGVWAFRRIRKKSRWRLRATDGRRSGGPRRSRTRFLRSSASRTRGTGFSPTPGSRRPGWTRTLGDSTSPNSWTRFSTPPVCATRSRTRPSFWKRRNGSPSLPTAACWSGTTLSATFPAPSRPE